MPLREIAPNPNTKSNPNANRGAIFLGSNVPDTLMNMKYYPRPILSKSYQQADVYYKRYAGYAIEQLFRKNAVKFKVACRARLTYFEK